MLAVLHEIVGAIGVEPTTPTVSMTPGRTRYCDLAYLGWLTGDGFAPESPLCWENHPRTIPECMQDAHASEEEATVRLSASTFRFLQGAWAVRRRLKGRHLNRRCPMRIFLVPVGLLRALSRGAPGLHDAMARVMVGGHDPEVEVRRVREIPGGACSWYVRVAGGDHVEDLALGLDDEAMSAALVLFVLELAEDLRAELPHVMSRPEIVHGLDRLFPWLKALSSSRPS